MLSALSNPWLITVASSELFLVIVRSGEIGILAKNESQRTSEEQSQVSRGLRRSLVLESILFVPASAILALLLFPPLAAARFPSLFATSGGVAAFYAGLGIISYGFPFAALRKIVTTVALNTLREFASLHNADVSLPIAEQRKVRGAQD